MRDFVKRTLPEDVTLTGCIKSKIWKRFEVIAKFAPMKSASPRSRFWIIPPYSVSAVHVLLTRFHLDFIHILSGTSSKRISTYKRESELFGNFFEEIFRILGGIFLRIF